MNGLPPRRSYSNEELTMKIRGLNSDLTNLEKRFNKLLWTIIGIGGAIIGFLVKIVVEIPNISV